MRSRLFDIVVAMRAANYQWNNLCSGFTHLGVRIVKGIFLLLGVAHTIIQVVGCASVPPEASALVGHPVPDGRLMLLSGEDRALKDSQGRNRAILFWATWCAHSRSVIAQFEDMAREYAHRGNTEFFAVNLDRNEDLELVRGRITAQELTTVTHVFSGNDVQDEAFLALKGGQVPYAVFIDGRAIVRHVGVGLVGLEDFLKTYLSVSRRDRIQAEAPELSELADLRP